MKLFVVGAQVKQIVDCTKSYQPLLDTVWEILGVFDDEAVAIGHCTERHHFVGPIELNEMLPLERRPWQGSWYPLLQGKPE